MLGHYGVRLHRDSVIDRVNNGDGFSVSKVVRQVSINHPLIVKAPKLDFAASCHEWNGAFDHPFASSITLLDPCLTMSKPRYGPLLKNQVVQKARQPFTQAFAQRVGRSMVLPHCCSAIRADVFCRQRHWENIGNQDLTRGAGASDCRWLCRHGGQQPSIYAQSCGLMVEDDDLINIRAKIIRPR